VQIELVFLIADCAGITVLVAGILASRRVRPPSVPDMQAAFNVLGRSIEKYVEDMPAGFTWGEAFERFKDTGMKADWEKMERSLEEYEGFRYGGMKQPIEGKDEVVRLALRLRRSSLGKRTKGKGTGTS
jgi:hypothetical protein